jgi:hypothetical protein
VGNDRLLSAAGRVLVALGAAVTLAACSGGGSAETPRTTPSSSAPAPGSDEDLPLPAASAAAPVENVPAARAATLGAELRDVWGVRLVTADGTLRGTGADPGSGVRFAIEGRTRGDTVRGYACRAEPAAGRFAAPRDFAEGEPDPAVLASMETALGFLQTCANSSAADPDRATVWVRAVTQQVLAGTPAERRIGGVRFRLERSGDGLRLAVGTP